MSGPNTVAAYCNPADLQPGERQVDGITNRVQLLPQTSYTGITALAGGGALGATPLNIGLNEIDTVVTGGDSCLLPPAVGGATVLVFNNAGGNASSVYPQQANPNNASSAADTIIPAAGSTATSQSVTNNTVAIFRCFKPGYWKSTI